MKSSGIGGQAILEGVMMKNKEKYAVAVRKPDKEIAIEIKEYQSVGSRIPFFRLPIIRGVVAFAESLGIGMKALTYSASFYEEQEEKEKSKKLQTVWSIVTVVLSIILAVAIFMLLPYFISQLLNKVIHSQAVLTIIEGVVRILLFVSYVWAISLMKDIKRVFMYHGAEHKTINCLEHGLELNTENVKKQTTYHKRCGTSFMLIVMLISVVFFMVITVSSPVLRLVLRLLLIPVIAGVSYEFIRFAGNSEDSIKEIYSGKGSGIIKFLKSIRYVIVFLLSKPGKWLQSLTTREPEEDMIEVAIASVEAVFDWKEFLECNSDRKKRTVKNSKNTGVKAVRRLEKDSDDSLERELEQLDKILGTEHQDKQSQMEEGELAAAEEKRSDLKNRSQCKNFETEGTKNETSQEETEEDDTVLQALDKYFVYEPEEEDRTGYLK